MSTTGRLCPIRYRYGAAALQAAPPSEADTLYVVGGLYGNPIALDALDDLLDEERGPVRVCFNGDFHWFDVARADFADIDRRVARHDATLGNVEAELLPGAGDAGCGCAYPASVDDATVERSNAIHARLKATALAQPAVLRRLAALPMVARYRVGGLAVGVVHGDADSLAGWRFDIAALDDPAEAGWLAAAFEDAGVSLFASSHTCLPALRQVGPARAIINNGAAGLANFRGNPDGVVTRIALREPPRPPLYGTRLGGVRVDALPLPIDIARWLPRFLASWPEGSAAHTSYLGRILSGPDHDIRRAGGAL